MVDVLAVEVVRDHSLRPTFADGRAGEVDFAGREWKGVFAPLADPGFFAGAAVDAEAGTIAWPNGVDMAPEPLYEGLGRQAASR